MKRQSKSTKENRMRNVLLRGVSRISRPTHMSYTHFFPLRNQSHCSPAGSVAAGSSTSATPEIPKELQFTPEDFEMSEVDYHFPLLEEAHKKHGVFLNVPPQLPPNGSPPEVPEVIFCEILTERLRAIKLSYAPTHGPPPLVTCGTRGLESASVVETSISISTGKLSTTSSSPTPGDEPSTERLPIEEDKKYHCSICAKPFKILVAGNHHVSTAHPDKTATLENGPGPGELIEKKVTPVPHTPDGKSMATTSRITSAKKKEYSEAELILPDELDIETLLTGTWDMLGPKLLKNEKEKFKPSTDVVAGQADKRPPPGSEKPSASATPAGAAPGIKQMSGNVPKSRSSAVPLGPSGKPMTIQEMSARFESPFTDSEEIDIYDPNEEMKNPFLPPDVAEYLDKVYESELNKDTKSSQNKSSNGNDIDGGTLKPFVSTKPGSKSFDGLGDVKKTLAEKKSFDFTSTESIGGRKLPSDVIPRRMKCHLCDASFRILEGLHTHYEEEHGDYIPDDLLQHYMKLSSRNPLYENKISPARERAMANCENGNMDDQEKNDKEEKNSRFDKNNKDIIPPEPLEKKDINIHIRAATNMIVVGKVLEVKRGFYKSLAVTQVTVETTDTARTPTESQKSSDSKETSEASNTVEYITIRCFGDEYHGGIFQQAIRVGSCIMVNGVLKMNRHLDKVSNRVHAYPFVQVMSPMGTLHILE